MPKTTGRRGEKPNPAHSRKAERLASMSAMAESIWHDEAEAHAGS